MPWSDFAGAPGAFSCYMPPWAASVVSRLTMAPEIDQSTIWNECRSAAAIRMSQRSEVQVW